MMTPDELCLYLHLDNETMLAITANPETPLEMAVWLMDNGCDPTLAANVAANPNTPADILVRIHSEHKDNFDLEAQAQILRAVANNPNTPAMLLNTLSTHPDIGVRLNVVTNSVTTHHTFTAMAEADNQPWQVLSLIAENVFAPPRALQAVISRGEPYTRALAEMTLSIQEEMGMSDPIDD